MKVTVFDCESWEQEHFQTLSDAHDVTILAERLTPENAAEHADAEVISTFIDSRFTTQAIERLESLKLIATRSTGFDHIPLEACRKKGVTVCNVPTYGSNTVAEHVFGLLLVISHKLDQAIERTRKGDFSSEGLQGFDLCGKTMGVIGTGDIGRETIRIAKGFGLEVLAYDVQPNQPAAKRLGFDYTDIDDLLTRCDIVSLHVPASEQTRNLLSDDQFDKMKPGAVLINTSRGTVVDTKALVRALAEGKLAAAGLDVLPEEPVIREEAELLRSVYEREHGLSDLLANHVLVNLRNVVVTPHSAFRTREAVQRIIDTTVQNIKSFAAGKAENVVSSS